MLSLEILFQAILSPYSYISSLKNSILLAYARSLLKNNVMLFLKV